ncbi:zinc finger protein 480-like [Thunnus maccoyii]|uniref:zinc finger protein 480-like n=1 Tax=Thunnus maccoyii TaxID=8240 RepID=UPI001C4B2F2F|nr:zinc finger protein 480-like [Thunnus maccoyii]
MSSVECLREFINERLTAAAEEIFGVFQKTIVNYEEEINRQRRLLDIIWKPEIKLHRIELPQQHVCKEDLADQQLFNQERNSSLDQEDPEPPQIKDEQDELCNSLEGEQLVLKQETKTFMLTPTCEESDNSEDQTLDLSPDETQSATENEHVVSMSVKSSVVPEPNSDDQLLSHNSHVAESQDHKGGKQGDSGSTGNTETKPQKSHHKSKKKKRTQLNNHTGKKVLNCDTCGRAFKRVSHLNRHRKVHTGERPYPCNTCEKRFFELNILKVHMRIHTGERPYPCTFCEKRFTYLYALKAHTRIHTGEKPYKCNTCEKRFIEQSSLKAHMRIHTGEKPYPCTFCEKRFTYLYALKLHMRVHTGEKPYNCKTCGKDFSRGDYLKIHMRTHSGKRLSDV